MKLHRGVAALLKQAGATFVRRSKHYIFALPNGKKLTVAGTPSDRNAYKNKIRDIQKAGGLVEEKHKNPDRVAKQGRLDSSGRPVTREWYAADKKPAPRLPSLADQLSAYGITERAQRQQIEDLQGELAIKNATIEYQEERIGRFLGEIERLEDWECHCSICRLRRYFHA